MHCKFLVFILIYTNLVYILTQVKEFRSQTISGVRRVARVGSNHHA